MNELDAVLNDATEVFKYLDAHTWLCYKVAAAAAARPEIRKLLRAELRNASVTDLYVNGVNRALKAAGYAARWESCGSWAWHRLVGIRKIRR